MNAPLSNPAELRRIADLEAAVTGHDAAIGAAESALADVRGRRSLLSQRLATHRRARPTASVEVDDALITALAADPAGASAGGSYEAALERQRAARAAQDEWQVQLSVIEAAIAKLDPEVERAEAKLEDVRGSKEAAWATFVREAHEALASEFEVRFAALRDELIEPLMALADARALDGHAKVSSDTLPRLDDTTVVALRWFEPLVEHPSAPIGQAVVIAPEQREGARYGVRTPERPAVVHQPMIKARVSGGLWRTEQLFQAARAKGAGTIDRTPHLARLRIALAASRSRRR